MKYGLIGEKLGHSFSKEVHAQLADYEYEIREIAKDELSSFMLNKDFKAINVTIPYKEAVIPYLYSISDEAKAIGAVNTIVNRDGKLYGYNTDFLGMCALIDHANIEVKDKKAVILGSGGTAKTSRAVLTHLGAREIITVGRNARSGIISYGELEELHTDADIIVNTTPVGMFPSSDACPIDLSLFKSVSGVIDAIYNPLRTNLVLDAIARGINAEGGLYMLVAQAVYASEIFLDVKYAPETLDKVYSQVRSGKENIVLIGMPSCGKSTVGALLEKKTQKELIDTDSLISKAHGLSIPDIFKKFGESEFRLAESTVIDNISSQNNRIISTGGGAVLNLQNVRRLKQNGKLFFIDRSPDNLIPTADRPLSASREDIMKRYDERYEIYRKSADTTVNGDQAPEQVAENIRGDFFK